MAKSDAIRARVTQVEEMRDRIEKLNEDLWNAVTSHLKQLQEFTTAYVDEHRSRYQSPYDFWTKTIGLKYYEIPAPSVTRGCNVNVHTETSGAEYVSIVVEDDRDGDKNWYRLPYAFIDAEDPEAYLVELKASWDKARTEHEQAVFDATRDERYAKYLKLHAEFGQQPTPLTLEEFDAANPDQS